MRSHGPRAWAIGRAQMAIPSKECTLLHTIYNSATMRADGVRSLFSHLLSAWLTARYIFRVLAMRSGSQCIRIHRLQLSGPGPFRYFFFPFLPPFLPSFFPEADPFSCGPNVLEVHAMNLRYSLSRTFSTPASCSRKLNTCNTQ